MHEHITPCNSSVDLSFNVVPFILKTPKVRGIGDCAGYEYGLEYSNKYSHAYYKLDEELCRSYENLIVSSLSRRHYEQFLITTS